MLVLIIAPSFCLIISAPNQSTTGETMPSINSQRLLDDLKELRHFGACGNGVVRRSLSEVDLASRQWLIGKLGEAGLDAEIDGLGTVLGRSKNPGKALLIGSHTDTQPTGGWLDGAMGVIYGLEVARALRESDETKHLAVDVASWIDEEGTYVGLLGSLSFCGDLPEDAIEQGISDDGHRLTDALKEAGLSGRAVAGLERDRYVGYLEAHIEQGPYLEAEQKRIGVVTTIIGMRDYDVVFHGQQNHAGTTPMPLRKDAGTALIEFGHQFKKGFDKIKGERSVYTIGNVEFVPGAPSIIPGEARMILQFRDPEMSRIEALEAHLRELVAQFNQAGAVLVELSGRANDADAADMDEGLQEHIAAAARQHAPDDWIRMPSGAAHDAQVLAKHLPCAMLFVPSIGGISHDFSEDTEEDDIALGCQVLATAAASILQEVSSG